MSSSQLHPNPTSFFLSHTFTYLHLMLSPITYTLIHTHTLTHTHTHLSILSRALGRLIRSVSSVLHHLPHLGVSASLGLVIGLPPSPLAQTLCEPTADTNTSPTHLCWATVLASSLTLTLSLTYTLTLTHTLSLLLLRTCCRPVAAWSVPKDTRGWVGTT